MIREKEENLGRDKEREVMEKKQMRCRRGTERSRLNSGKEKVEGTQRKES
jgi:hypothetical protein